MKALLALLAAPLTAQQLGPFTALQMYQQACGRITPRLTVTVNVPTRMTQSFTIPDSTGRPVVLQHQWGVLFPRVGGIDSGGVYVAKLPARNLVLLRTPTPNGGWLQQAWCVDAKKGGA